MSKRISKKRELTWKKLNEGLIIAVANELYEERFGKIPEWALRNDFTFWFWYHFRGGKHHIAKNMAYVHGVRDYIAWYSRKIGE